jgi:hypothetical protein
MKKIFSIIAFAFLCNNIHAQKIDIENIFKNPPESAKPWVFWYWMNGCVSKAGITADLEAMKEVGLGGAYLMPIKDTAYKIDFQPQVRQLTPEWFDMVSFAVSEAKRLNLKLGIHVSDGFALAGGPWITPEMSMQKIVFTKTFVQANSKIPIILPQPKANENYYKDIAVYAYPANYKNEISLKNLQPLITTSNNADASFLMNSNNKQTFRSDTACWIQYSYTQPITIRQVKIMQRNNAYQAQRFIIQSSTDGISFTAIDTLVPPRHGWQDWDEDYTHAVNNVITKHIRFVWQKEGTAPGSEDLDAAKWKPSLKVQGIYVSDEPIINNYEAKNGSVWRIAENTTTQQVNNTNAVPLNKIINLTNKLSNDGKLNWQPPTNSDYIIVRIGHTSTGHKNETAGGGKGLECDKFNTAAVSLQFKNWFENIYNKTNGKNVINTLHIDSWECGSQNWSNNFAAEFKKRRGYDLLPYLAVMAGVPIESASKSEIILHDVRKSIAELVSDNFYGTLNKLAQAKGLQISAESIAPTFVSDGLLHYKNVDIPMGEFWLNSPTHDKPNDMLDAISAAHIYGKNIVAAEAFTTLRMDWSEHPGMLKAIGDRNFAAGINKMVIHVFVHNPWIDKKPGMTLDGIGLYYQRDQTWFKQSKAWIEYLTRCQALLQLGKPVVDIGVFTGEEIPSRSLLPDRLINTLPGIFGKEKVAAEKLRLDNKGQPQRTIPDGVTHSANMADPENYVDALNGYKYDCFNPDVLMSMKVVNGRVVTLGGASYKVLVIPDKHPMNPNNKLSTAVKNKLLQLANAGAKIIMDKKQHNIKHNKVLQTPYYKKTFDPLCVKQDLIIYKNKNDIAWAHRVVDSVDIYFVSNQTAKNNVVEMKFNVENKLIETASFDYVQIFRVFDFDREGSYNKHKIFLRPYESSFFIFRKPIVEESISFPVEEAPQIISLNNKWKVKLENIDTVEIPTLIGWNQMKDTSFKFFSGTALYTNTFAIAQKEYFSNYKIRFSNIYNLATVKINGVNCGTLWTYPYELNITKALKQGENKIEIEVTNTWHNKLIGDSYLPIEKRTTWTNAPFRLKDKQLQPAGIIGDVKIIIE